MKMFMNFMLFFAVWIIVVCRRKSDTTFLIPGNTKTYDKNNLTFEKCTDFTTAPHYNWNAIDATHWSDVRKFKGHQFILYFLN